MNNVFVYLEIEGREIADVSLELLTKARTLAAELGVAVEAVAIGKDLDWVQPICAKYGATRLHLADDKRLEYYLTMPHERILCDIFQREKPQIALFGATSVGRDLGPRVSSALHSGLTADCTRLEIGEYKDAKAGKTYENLLFQIRPAFGGNIIATIVNPDCRPQMATVREGVMKREELKTPVACEVVKVDLSVLKEEDFLVSIISRQLEKQAVNIKGATLIVAGGYGVGSREGFNKLFELAHLLGGEVGASRAAVDAGFADHERQIGQTGVTVRPKLYIACGISGQVQHTAGMSESAMIISINTDPNAPINQIADYTVVGDYAEVIDRFIESYKRNSK
ncbi:MAG: electron transfer flavoprotein subunit alpha/FixB family protein [Bacteroides sp.]